MNARQRRRMLVQGVGSALKVKRILSSNQPCCANNDQSGDCTSAFYSLPWLACCCWWFCWRCWCWQGSKGVLVLQYYGSGALEMRDNSILSVLPLQLLLETSHDSQHSLHLTIAIFQWTRRQNACYVTKRWLVVSHRPNSTSVTDDYWHGDIKQNQKLLKNICVSYSVWQDSLISKTYTRAGLTKQLLDWQVLSAHIAKMDHTRIGL